MMMMFIIQSLLHVVLHAAAPHMMIMFIIQSLLHVVAITVAPHSRAACASCRLMINRVVVAITVAITVPLTRGMRQLSPALRRTIQYR